MYVYIISKYIYIYIYIYVCIMHIYIITHTCTCRYEYMYIYNMNIYEHLCRYVFCLCVRICTYTYLHLPTYIYIYIYLHILWEPYINKACSGGLWFPVSRRLRQSPPVQCGCCGSPASSAAICRGGQAQRLHGPFKTSNNKALEPQDLILGVLWMLRVFWLFKGGCKASSSIVEWYISSSGTDVEKSEIASFAVSFGCWIFPDLYVVVSNNQIGVSNTHGP